MSAVARIEGATWLGRVLGGRYRVEQRIGAGGMASVYEAVNTWTERRVALKLLDPTLDRSRERAQRFLHEARSAARIEHPHIVSILDMGEDESTGALYIVQELLRGRDLRAELLLRRPSRLRVAECLTFLSPIAEALEAAHRCGVVHCDVTPANVFLARSGERVIPKLIDFGLAGSLRHGDRRAGGPSGIAGTLPYLAPEQLSGEVGGWAVDARADVWALGVVFYRCLTGALPWDAGDTSTLLKMHAHDRLVPVDERAEVPTQLASVVHRALDMDPKRRWSSMTALLDALRAARE